MAPSNDLGIASSNDHEISREFLMKMHTLVKLEIEKGELV